MGCHTRRSQAGSQSQILSHQVSEKDGEDDQPWLCVLGHGDDPVGVVLNTEINQPGAEAVLSQDGDETAGGEALLGEVLDHQHVDG